MSQKMIVRDRRRSHQFIIHNLIIDDWLPIIGTTGLALYSLYCRLANREDERAFPSYTMIQRHLGLSRTSIAAYNLLLQLCGLIHIEPGTPKRPNIYYLLEVPEVTPERLAELAERIRAHFPNPYRDRFLKRIEAWQSLRDQFRTSQASAPTPSETPELDSPLSGPGSPLSEPGSPLSGLGSPLSGLGSPLSGPEQPSCNNHDITTEYNNQNKQQHQQHRADNVGDGDDGDNGSDANQEKHHIRLIFTKSGISKQKAIQLAERTDLLRALEWGYWLTSAPSEMKNPAGYAVRALEQDPEACPPNLKAVWDQVSRDPHQFRCRGTCAFCAPGGPLDRALKALRALADLPPPPEDGAEVGEEAPIGALAAPPTPEQWSEAARSYPMAWVVEAIRLACRSGWPQWGYVIRILERWAANRSSPDPREWAYRKQVIRSWQRPRDTRRGA